MLTLFSIGTFASAQKEDKPSDQVQVFKNPTLPDWMSVDLELRGRTEARTSLDYKSGNDWVYQLTRVRGGIGIRAPKYFSAYAQFHDIHALGLPLADQDSGMRDVFDLRQAYLEFQSPVTTVFAGRQVLRFGDERLIGIRNWTNVSRTFDVIHARLGSEGNRLDLFSGAVVKIFPTSFDRPTGGFYLHGAYGILTTLVPRTRLEPFILLKTSLVTSLQGLPGREVMEAPGIRAVGDLPAAINYDVQGTFERGSYVNDSIHTGAAYLKAGYTARWLPWSPHLQPEYDYATGNPHRNPLRVSTFDQFYPSNHNVFGLTDLFGWQNIKQRRLNLDMQPRKDLSLLFQGESLHAATTQDNVYTGPAAVLVAPPTGGFRSDDIGSEIDASIRYASRFHLFFDAGAAHFWPGALMMANRHGTPLTLAYFQITYLMKWSTKEKALPGP
jgi:hypothetical protein